MAIVKRVVGQITLKVIKDVASTTYFYLLMPSTAPVPTKPTTNPPTVYTLDGYDGWQTTEPGYTSGDTRNLYITVRTVYSDGSFEYSDPSLSSSYEAAKEAYNRAQSAMNLAAQINQNIWQLTSPYSTDVPAGLYVSEVGELAFKPNPSGGNILLQSTGITLRDGATQLASLTGSALNFYNPSTGASQLTIGSNGALQSGNYVRGSNNKFAQAGTKIDLTAGDIITQYFRLSQGGESGGPTAGAYIHGTIEALDGSIGSDSTNYWEIGNYTDYNLSETAKMIGHGSSFIQLGDSSTWRLSTNRIHTGWHVTSDALLHFPEYTDGTNTLYWDYGFHTPTSKDDKFIYIRTAPNSTSLSNLLYDIDDSFTTHYWTYKLWIDGSGNIHAPGFYIGDSTTPIGGGTGTIAEKIINSDSTYGKGSTTQPVYVDSNGRVQTIGYTIAKSVPSDAKFTDTVTTVSVTGDGNAITSMSATNGAITATKDSTFLLNSARGAANGVVPLNASSKIDSTYLPSYVDDVLEYNGTSSFPSTGEAGKIYVDTSTNKTYRWGGSTYVEISQGSVVTISRSLTSGTKSATITIDGTSTDIYAPTNTNTTYTFANGTNGFTVTPSGGTAQTVTVTPSITNNVTGSGTSGYLTKWNGTNTITNGPAMSSTGTRYLKEDGSWGTPGGTYSLPIALYNTLGGIKPLYSWTNAIAETSATSITSTAPTINTRQTTSGRYYAIEIDKNGRLFVNVPWTNVNSSYLTSVSWSDINNKPTTLSGYGITDAKIANGVITLGSNTITPFTGVAVTNLSVNVDTTDNKTYLYVTKSNSSTPQKLSLEDISIVQAEGATTLVDNNGDVISVTGPVKFVNGKPETMTGTGSDTIPWSLISGAPSTYAVDLAKYNVLGGVKPWFSTTGASTLASGSAGSNSSTPSINARSTTTGRYYAIEIDKNGRLFVNVPWENTTYTIPTITQSAETNISIADHTTSNITTVGGTATVSSKKSGSNGVAPTLGTEISIIGVQSSTTSVTGVSGSTTVRGVKTDSTTTASKASGGNGTASSWAFEDKTVTTNPNIVYDSSDTSLTISFGTTTVSSKKSGSNGTAPTWSFTDVTVPIRADSNTTVPKAASSATTVPIKNTNATSIPNVTSVGSASTWVFEDKTVATASSSTTTVVTGKTHLITDNGHTHSI